MAFSKTKFDYMIAEKKVEEKRAAKREKEKKAEEKRQQEALAEKDENITEQQSDFSMTVMGSSVVEITSKMFYYTGVASTGTGAGSFDVKV